MKKWLTLVACVFVVIAMTSCALADAYTVGTYTAAAPGFGGDVEVTMIFDAAAITDVQIVGAKETTGIGSKAVEALSAAILQAQGAQVDAVAGATVTSGAIVKAAENCIAQAKGETQEIGAVKMKPGRYVAYAESFNIGDGLTVTVSVTEDRIRTIEVDFENNSDMKPILRAAIDHLIPRMIEHQSVTIDAVTGATASSNAIKNATAQAVTQALIAGGSDASAIENFYVSLPQTGETIELETEVLVVGMGGSGSAAALSAAEGGAQVLAIEKAGKYGGTTFMTCDVFNVNPPRYKAEHNNGEDYVDAEALFADWMAYTEGDAKEEIVRKLFDHSGEMLDWLIYDVGAKLEAPVTSMLAASPYAVVSNWVPSNIWNNAPWIQSYFDLMIDKFTALGGQYMLETEGYELIYDEADNKVTGVKARNTADGTEYIITADVVIMATGGYMGSTELQEQLLKDTYYPINGIWKHYGTRQNDGKMIKAALEIGAGTYNASMPPEVHSCSTASWLTEFPKHYLEGQKSLVANRDAYWTEGDLPMFLGWCADSLAVDVYGNRFTSETGVSFLDPWIAGPRYFSIWSDKQIRKIEAEGFDALNPSIFFGSLTSIPPFTPVPNVDAVLEAAVEADLMVKADSIEELAEKLGMDAATLKQTVDTYNSYCARGVDEQFGKPAEYLDAVEGGPYYAVNMYSYAYGSCGGLDINENFQVLKVDGETAIGGLYCLGTDSMGVLFTEKKPYVTYGGANNGWSLTSGYLCGQEVAQMLGH